MGTLSRWCTCRCCWYRSKHGILWVKITLLITYVYNQQLKQPFSYPSLSLHHQLDRSRDHPSGGLVQRSECNVPPDQSCSCLVAAAAWAVHLASQTSPGSSVTLLMVTISWLIAHSSQIPCLSHKLQSDWLPPKWHKKIKADVNSAKIPRP
jgi:hypothetical protein